MVSMMPPTQTPWLLRHGKQVLLGLGVVALASLLIGWVFHNLQAVRRLAWDQLSSAQTLFSQGKISEATQAVDQILASHRSGSLAIHAHLLKGDMALQGEKKDQAIPAYEAALGQSATPELRAVALGALAAAHEELQKWPEAEKLHTQFTVEFPDHFLTPRTHLGISRLQMAQQKWVEAQSTLERLITLYPSTPWAQEAQELLPQTKGRN
jgi:hypothetical protein